MPRWLCQMRSATDRCTKARILSRAGPLAPPENAIGLADRAAFPHICGVPKTTSDAPAATAAIADIGGRNFIGRFVGAASTVISGIPFALKNRRLLLLVGAPIAIQMCVFFVFVVSGGSWLHEMVAGVDLGIDEASSWHFLETIVDVILSLLAFVGAFVIGLLLTLMVGNIVAGPVLDTLSERTEDLLVGGRPEVPFSLAGFLKEVVVETVYAVVRLGVFLVGLFFVFLFGLVPVVGQIVAPVLSVFWTAMFLAVEIMNAPLARHGLRGFRRLAFLVSNLSLTLGVGLTAWLASFIPVTLPFLVVGATRLYVSLAVHDRVASRFDRETKARLGAVRSS
jgi:CysZ protein